MIIALFASLSLAASSQVIPTRYEAGHFYAVPQTASGRSMRLMVDTGGGGVAGMYWISAATNARLHLSLAHCEVDGRSLTVATPPAYVPGRGLPGSIGPCHGSLLINPGRFPVDGQMGASYLGTRVWTFDYPQRQLRVEGDHWHPGRAAHSLPLGFQRDGKGKVLQHFPRIVVHVDGRPLDMLLDTGATARPTAQGKAAAGTATVDGMGVTSYITTSTFERWHKAHPEWPLVQTGDDLFAPRFTARLIRVPQLEIGAWSVGPVWFTERPDAGFHDVLDAIMDRPPAGAIGGNVLAHFSLTLDYPHAMAWLNCASGCVTTTKPAHITK